MINKQPNSGGTSHVQIGIINMTLKICQQIFLSKIKQGIKRQISFEQQRKCTSNEISQHSVLQRHVPSKICQKVSVLSEMQSVWQYVQKHAENLFPPEYCSLLEISWRTASVLLSILHCRWVENRPNLLVPSVTNTTDQ